MARQQLARTGQTTWQESLDFIAGMNAEQYQGHGDWRLPNRRELRSLISHQTRRPALIRLAEIDQRYQHAGQWIAQTMRHACGHVIHGRQPVDAAKHRLLLNNGVSLALEVSSQGIFSFHMRCFQILHSTDQAVVLIEHRLNL